MESWSMEHGVLLAAICHLPWHDCSCELQLLMGRDVAR